MDRGKIQERLKNYTPKPLLSYRSWSLAKAATPSEWNSIVSYVKSLTDIRKNMCGGCGKGFLYDIANKSYLIKRTNTLQQVKDIVETIRKINTENAG